MHLCAQIELYIKESFLCKYSRSKVLCQCGTMFERVYICIGFTSIL